MSGEVDLATMLDLDLAVRGTVLAVLETQTEPCRSYNPAIFGSSIAPILLRFDHQTC